MFVMVFGNDKDKLINKGCKLICEQNMNNGIGYIFKNNKKINFEKEDIQYFKINKINL